MNHRSAFTIFFTKRGLIQRLTITIANVVKSSNNNLKNYLVNLEFSRIFANIESLNKKDEYLFSKFFCDSYRVNKGD